MKLSKNDALFLYGILFKNSLSSDLIDSEVFDDLSQMMTRLSQFILGGESSDEDDSEEETTDDEVEDSCVESTFTIDEYVTTSHANRLTPAQVKSDAGKNTMRFEFEDVDLDDAVDVLLECGDVIIDSVTAFRRSENTLSVFNGKWSEFTIVNLPKSWRRFEVDKVYGFKAEEEE
jgi:hypothetical protein